MTQKFRTVGGSKNYKAWKDWGEGDYIIGKFEKTGIQETKYGEQQWYDTNVLATSMDDVKVNKTFRFNGNGSMDFAMEEVEPGETIRVEYEGLKTLESGNFKGKEFHAIKVEVAEEEQEDLSGL